MLMSIVEALIVIDVLPSEAPNVTLLFALRLALKLEAAPPTVIPWLNEAA